jgi:integrase
LGAAIQGCEPLTELQLQFGFSAFEAAMVVVALAREVDLRYERIYSYLQDDVTRRLPTVDLVLSLLCESAAEKSVRREHISLPRGLSPEQALALWSASEGRRPRNLRDRALLLVLLRLALRAGQVPNIALAGIDWRSGLLKIRSAKTYRDRILLLPQEVGQAMAAYLNVQGRRLTPVFEPRRPPFTEQRRRTHVGNSMRYLFASAGITDRGLHSLRHTAVRHS